MKTKKKKKTDGVLESESALFSFIVDYGGLYRSIDRIEDWQLRNVDPSIKLRLAVLKEDLKNITPQVDAIMDHLRESDTKYYDALDAED